MVEKFKYNDRVQITSEFYGIQIGRVKQFRKNSLVPNGYLIQFEDGYIDMVDEEYVGLVQEEK